MTALRRTAAYIAIWSLVALGFAVALATTERLSWPVALTAGVGTALPAALLGLAVLALCERVPLRRTGYGRLLVVHAAAAVAFSALWCGAIAVEMSFGRSREALDDFLRTAVPWQLVMGVVVYALIAGVAYARASQRREEEQTRAAERAETLRLRAELGALRARLDPHFLFNVLQTIGTLATERPAHVHVALEHLASLLRRRLVTDEASDVAPLADEMTDVRDFLALERLRYGDRLEVAEEIDPETLELLLPRFTLQPIVENAVHHGLAARAAGGRLSISARRSGSHWTLSVADDGVGAEPARFAAGTGIGVSVVRERLRLRFGAEAEFAVATSPGNGCRVELRLPCVSDDDVSSTDVSFTDASFTDTSFTDTSRNDPPRIDPPMRAPRRAGAPPMEPAL